MAYLDHLPLDIQLSPIELFFQKLNAVNGLSLLHSDFVLQDPQPFQDARFPKANTSVTIQPKLTSQYYNSFQLYYQRMDIASILDNPMVSIARGNGTHLSDLIAEINQAYNIHLTAEDYYDTPLQPVDPQDPHAESPVQITIKPTSHLFTGSYLLVLNKSTHTPDLVTNDLSDLYIAVDQPNEAIYQSVLLCKTHDGQSVSNFKFLRNAATITKVKIKDFFRLGKDLILQGDFQFHADLGQGSQDYTTNCLKISPTGKILEILHDKFGSQYDDLIKVENKLYQAHYVLDAQQRLGQQVTQLYRFTDDGQLDTAFQLIGVDEPLQYALVDLKGRIYAASQQKEIQEAAGTKKQYWIDRYLPDGSHDDSFTRIVLSMTHGEDVWPIANIDPIEDDYNTTAKGFYVCLAPTAQPTSAQAQPKVHDVPLLPPGVSSTLTPEYGYLPIMKFLDSGILDTQFQSAQLNYAPAAVYHHESQNQIDPHQQVISSVGNQLVFLTYRANPLLGLEHHYPVLYTEKGLPKLISGDHYLQTYFWTQVSTLKSIHQNYLFISGQCRLKTVEGTYQDAREVIACYHPDTTPAGIVYQSNELTTNPRLVSWLIYHSHR